MSEQYFQAENAYSHASHNGTHASNVDDLTLSICQSLLHGRDSIIAFFTDHNDSDAAVAWVNYVLYEVEHHRLFDDDIKLGFRIATSDERARALLRQYMSENRWTREQRADFERAIGLGPISYDEQHTQPVHRFEDFDAETLRISDVPDTKWIVKDLLPEGLASLAGRPKQGKSWLGLNIGIAVAQGGKALQAYEIPNPGSVLFLALEDNKARIKKRMKQLMRQVIPWPSRLKFSIYSPRMGAGFTEALRDWLTKNENPALIVVDMYTKVAPRRKHKSQSEYDDIYDDLAPLQELAYEFHICILLVMHLNKSADPEEASAAIMGSTAYAGATVTNLILRRNSGDEADATLSISSKDVEDEGDIALVFDRGIWKSRGNAEAYNQSEQRMAILQYLYMAQGNETIPKHIASALEKNPGTTRKLLQKMKEDGLVTKDIDGDTYRLTRLGAEAVRARKDDEGRERNLDVYESDSSDDSIDTYTQHTQHTLCTQHTQCTQSDTDCFPTDSVTAVGGVDTVYDVYDVYSDTHIDDHDPKPTSDPASDLSTIGCTHPNLIWDDVAGVSVCADCGECVDDKMSLAKPACHVCGVTSGDCSHMRKQNGQV